MIEKQELIHSETKQRQTDVNMKGEISDKKKSYKDNLLRQMSQKAVRDESDEQMKIAERQGLDQ